MSESDWRVYCPNGHAGYMRLRDVYGEDIQDGTVTFSACPECGAPRRGEQLLPPR